MTTLKRPKSPPPPRNLISSIPPVPTLPRKLIQSRIPAPNFRLGPSQARVAVRICRGEVKTIYIAKPKKIPQKRVVFNTDIAGSGPDTTASAGTVPSDDLSLVDVSVQTRERSNFFLRDHENEKTKLGEQINISSDLCLTKLTASETRRLNTMGFSAQAARIRCIPDQSNKFSDISSIAADFNDGAAFLDDIFRRPAVSRDDDEESDVDIALVESIKALDYLTDRAILQASTSFNPSCEIDKNVDVDSRMKYTKSGPAAVDVVPRSLSDTTPYYRSEHMAPPMAVKLLAYPFLMLTSTHWPRSLQRSTMFAYHIEGSEYTNRIMPVVNRNLTGNLHLHLPII